MDAQLIQRAAVAQAARMSIDIIYEEIPATTRGNFLETRLGEWMDQEISVHQALNYDQTVTSTGK